MLINFSSRDKLGIGLVRLGTNILGIKVHSRSVAQDGGIGIGNQHIRIVLFGKENKGVQKLVNPHSLKKGMRPNIGLGTKGLEWGWGWIGYPRISYPKIVVG